MTEPSREVLRIIDANLNRAAEGLRLLEEFARLSLNDERLSRRLKEMRHVLLAVPLEMQERLIAARDAAGDVGRDMKVSAPERGRGVFGDHRGQCPPRAGVAARPGRTGQDRGPAPGH